MSDEHTPERAAPPAERALLVQAGEETMLYASSEAIERLRAEVRPERQVMR